jgi:hypothetical protein
MMMLKPFRAPTTIWVSTYAFIFRKFALKHYYFNEIRLLPENSLKNHARENSYLMYFLTSVADDS